MYDISGSGARQRGIILQKWATEDDPFFPVYRVCMPNASLEPTPARVSSERRYSHPVNEFYEHVLSDRALLRSAVSHQVFLCSAAHAC